MIETHIEGRVRVTTFTGEVTAHQLGAHTQRVMSAPDYDPTMAVVFDMSGIAALHFNHTDVMQAEEKMRLASAGHPGRRIAFVAASPVTFGYARMFQILHEQTADKVEIFETLDEARAWIGSGTDPVNAIAT